MALEANALSAIALYTLPRKFAEAREVLERLHADATRLLKALKSMGSIELPTELDTARLLLLEAHSEKSACLPSATPLPDSLLTQLEIFIETSGRALANSHKIKERSHSASPEPIRYIVELLGMAEVGTGGRFFLGGSLGRHFLITRSMLCEVASICYEAAGRENTDPERAVEAYFRQEEAREERLQQDLNLQAPEPPTEEQKAALRAFLESFGC